MGSCRFGAIYLMKTINNYCFIWVPMANTMTFLHEGFPLVPVDLEHIFDENINNYCFIWVPMANTITFLHEGFPWVPVDFKLIYFTYTLTTMASYEFLWPIR